jgi:hypothetical protein
MDVERRRMLGGVIKLQMAQNGKHLTESAIPCAVEAALNFNDQTIIPNTANRK